MLYNVDLLKRDGRFGVLWYLGNANPSSSNVPKKLKRKLVDRVVVRRMCSEVSSIILYPKSGPPFILVRTNPGFFFVHELTF